MTRISGHEKRELKSLLFQVGCRQSGAFVVLEGVIIKVGECYTARNGIPYNTAPKITSKYSYGSWNLFHSDDNRSEFGAILDDLSIKINVFSHICILRNGLNWTDAVIWHTY